MQSVKERPVTSNQMKEIEKVANDSGLSYLRLMENAGSAAFAYLKKHFLKENSKVTILCGSGNNGGDGFVVARKLFENEIPCTLVLTNGAPKTQDAKTMFDRLKLCEIELLNYPDFPRAVLNAVDDCDVVVDAIFGTGFKGDVDEPLCELFSYLNKSGKTVVSLDIPSGIYSDSAECANVFVNAKATVCFSFLKPAHIIKPGKDFCGEVSVADIGIEASAYENIKNPICVIDETLVKSLFKKRDELGNKGTFGRLLNIAGSENYSGAAVLSTKSALRSGVGLVTLATTPEIINSLRSTLFENTFLNVKNEEELDSAIEKSSAVLIGCGLSKNFDLVKKAVEKTTTCLIIDADGINSINGEINILRNTKAKVILTPHVGEFARLVNLEISQVKKNRINLASEFAKENNVTLVLKDSVTVVATRDKTYILSRVNSGLAKGGSGDVLSGIIASLCAQGYSSEHAAVLGVYLHSKAALSAKEKLSASFMQAGDVIDNLSLEFKILEE